MENQMQKTGLWFRRVHCAAFRVLRVFPAMALAAVLALGSVASQAMEQSVYTLGGGDKLRVMVFGEADLSGEFEVDGSGQISMPLIGKVSAGGRTATGFEKEIVRKLLDGYLISPQVSVEVLNYRPFYILGEVKKPGSYAYVEGITVLKAIALAGGYTYRANEKDPMVIRGDDTARRESKTSPKMVVLPGDIIRIKERFF